MDNNSQIVAGSDGVSVHSGFPNPALDHRGQTRALALDLNQLLVRHPSGTYLFRVAGHRWSDQGIYDGDIAVIDRSLPPQPADLIIIWQGDDFRLQRRRELDSDEIPWGVVTAVIHQYR